MIAQRSKWITMLITSFAFLVAWQGGVAQENSTTTPPPKSIPAPRTVGG